MSSDESLVDESNAIHVSGKSKSAKSRDSGIEEMVTNWFLTSQRLFYRQWHFTLEAIMLSDICDWSILMPY